jgi:hypothetical protein
MLGGEIRVAGMSALAVRTLFQRAIHLTFSSYQTNAIYNPTPTFCLRFKQMVAEKTKIRASSRKIEDYSLIFNPLYLESAFLFV